MTPEIADMLSHCPTLEIFHAQKIADSYVFVPAEFKNHNKNNPVAFVLEIQWHLIFSIVNIFIYGEN